MSAIRGDYIGPVLGLPPHVTACLFDLDGVLTQTALVHNAAWKQTFDAFLRDVVAAAGTAVRAVRLRAPTTTSTSTAGSAPTESARSSPRGASPCPKARPTTVPTRRPSTASATARTILVLQKIQEGAVQVYPGSVDYLHAATTAGLRRAVVSASANCADVLRAAGIADLLEVRVDGVTARRATLARQAGTGHLPARQRSCSVWPRSSVRCSRMLWPAWPRARPAGSAS